MSKVAEILQETAEWLEKQGRGLGNSFEYQGGSRIEAEYRQKAEQLRTCAAAVRSMESGGAAPREERHPETD